MILHYLSLAPGHKAHFSELKRDLPDITPRALSMKLTELQEHGLIDRIVKTGMPVEIASALTDKGLSLTEALKPVQQWARQYRDSSREGSERT
mgnify:CR=1 FL=1